MALIPPFFMDSVVAIGIKDDAGKSSWVATGFLYGFKTPFEGEEVYHVYLVTNHHVIANIKKLVVRFNPQAEGPAKEYNIDLYDANEKPIWYSSGNEIDIVVIPIVVAKLREDGMTFAYFRSDKEEVIRVDKMKEAGITEGDFIYVLGFPMGLEGEQKKTVIVRSGIIARVKDTLERYTKEYLIDTSIFPGSSGSPVVLKPEMLAIQGTKSHNVACLIGIVKAYLSYKDIAISSQTKLPRIIFEENSGLAVAYPVDCIEDAIMKHIGELRSLRAQVELPLK